jgi:methanogenic corrinoid protein MtbC1
MLLYMVVDRYGRQISDYYKSQVEADEHKEDATDFVMAIDDCG